MGPGPRAYGTFAVGSGPHRVAFDGTSIWVANKSSDTVTKLRASDGTALGTFSVGSAPIRVAFDGASIWVANDDSDTVTKLRASDGAALGTFAVGSFPDGVAFDGTSIWVVNNSNDNVTKLRTSDGAPWAPSPSARLRAGWPSTAPATGSRTRQQQRDQAPGQRGAALGTFPVGSCPFGVAFDGTSIWVANNGSNNVTKLRASDGAALGTFAVGSNPMGWPSTAPACGSRDNGSNNVTKLRTSDGAALGTFPAGSYPVGRGLRRHQHLGRRRRQQQRNQSSPAERVPQPPRPYDTRGRVRAAPRRNTVQTRGIVPLTDRPQVSGCEGPLCSWIVLPPSTTIDWPVT